MFGIIKSALFSVLGYTASTLFVKSIVFFGIFSVLQIFIPYIFQLIPDSSSISSLFHNAPSGLLYFFNLFEFGIGIKAVFTSLITAFVIRRIPIFG